MPFSEAVKVTVRKRAHHSCCLCKKIGIEIHHIIPQEERGPDTIENAAPLCPSCHETYGANSTKRKMITEARDLWYDICDKRYASDYDQLNELKRDVAFLKEELGGIKKVEEIVGRLSAQLREAGALANDQTIQGASLTELLTILINIEDTHKISKKSGIDVLYNLIFDTIGNESDQDTTEFNVLRDSFVEAYGEFIAKKLCHYISSVDNIDWSNNYTEIEIGNWLNHAFVVLLMFMCHEDVHDGPEAMKVYMNDDGLFTAALSEKNHE